jgi:hypothetical protein
LRIETGILEALALHAGTADANEVGEFLNFDTPGLVIGEMPVEAVDLEASEDIKVLLDAFYGEEMSADVQHEAPVRETGSVFDGDTRGVPEGGGRGIRRFNSGREELEERLDGVEDAWGVGSVDEYLVGKDIEAVSFVWERGSGVDAEGEKMVVVKIIGEIDVGACVAKTIGEELSGGARLWGNGNGDVIFKLEDAALEGKGVGKGDDGRRVGRRRRLVGTGGEEQAEQAESVFHRSSSEVQAKRGN